MRTFHLSNHIKLQIGIMQVLKRPFKGFVLVPFFSHKIVFFYYSSDLFTQFKSLKAVTLLMNVK